MQIQLVIEPGEPPLGTVCACEGTAMPFTGWLELLGLLSALLAGPAHAEIRTGDYDQEAGDVP
jgi:hypothetical protein